MTLFDVAVDHGYAVAAAVGHIDAVRDRVDCQVVRVVPGGNCGGDRTGGAVDDRDIVAAGVGDVDAIRNRIDGQGDRCDAYADGCRDGAGGPINDRNVVAARVGHIDSARGGIDRYCRRCQTGGDGLRGAFCPYRESTYSQNPQERCGDNHTRKSHRSAKPSNKQSPIHIIFSPIPTLEAHHIQITHLPYYSVVCDRNSLQTSYNQWDRSSVWVDPAQKARRQQRASCFLYCRLDRRRLGDRIFCVSRKRLRCHASWVEPIRKRSHSRAAPRPSLMAQTTRLWPRRMSPAAKTLGTLVAKRP